MERAKKLRERVVGTSYAKKEFGERLAWKLGETKDPVLLAKWAFFEYHEHIHDLEPGLQSLMFELVVMEEGPPFEKTEQQLLEFVEELQREDGREGIFPGSAA